MPKAKFEEIYRDLKRKIEAGEYAYQAMLPSENTLVEVYACSRNTVRRAIAGLAEDGCVQAIHGKGVQVIYQPAPDKTAFTIGGIETFQESARRNRIRARTRVLRFATVTTDAALARATGFAEGSELYEIYRVRYLGGKALILDINYFLQPVIHGLSAKIAEHSIYEYIENELGVQIVTSKRRMTVERATPLDAESLDLGDYNCLAVVRGQTFNADGVMFEYTESRHHPEHFCFQDTATRKR